MAELTDNSHGVVYDHIAITRLRIFRMHGRWLVEYQRKPRWFLGLDRWWWFNDGTYVDYDDALTRINYLRETGYVSVAQFQSVKTFEVE